MIAHPELGFFDEGLDLMDERAYTSAARPFGEATILPPVTYRSKVFSDLEDEKVWTRSWVAVGTLDQIPNEGDLLPYTVGNHGIHVQRGPHGELTGRFNKAQHGGCRAVPQQCRTGVKTKCSYTSCGYSRDTGPINAADLGQDSPRSYQYLGVFPEKLLSVRVETLGPLIFVNIDPEGHRLDTDAEMDVGPVKPLTDGAVEPIGHAWLKSDANWKLLGGALSDDGSCDAGSRDHAILPDNETKAVESASSWIYPNLVVIRRQEEVACFILQPVGMGETVVRFSLFACSGDKPSASGGSEDSRKAPWLAEFERVSDECAKLQRTLEVWGTTKDARDGRRQLPPETSRQAHRFYQRHIEKLLEDHAYYWPSPLYHNRR